MITLFGNKDDPYYAGTQSAYRDSAKVLSQNIAEKDLVAVDFYNQPIWYFYFNFGFNHSNWIGLPPPHFSMSGKLAIYPEMQETITYLLGIKNPTSKIWLITEKKEIIEEMNYASALQQAGLSIHSAQTFYHKGQYPLVRLIEFDPEE